MTGSEPTETRPIAEGGGPRPLFAVVVCLLIAGVVWFIYAQTASFDFVFFDDNVYLMENDRVRDGLTTDNVRWAFLTALHSNWHPVTWLSYLADVTWFGFDAGAFHRTNVLLHGLNSILLFVVLSRLTKRAGLSAVVALLFAAHPLHVESVAWISERKDVLSLFFGLLTIWAYGAWAVGRRWWQYALVLVFFSLGLMAKPMLVTLPFLLLLLDYWPLRRWPHERLVPPAELWVDKLPLLMLALVGGIMTLAAQYAGGGVQTLETIPLDERLANAPVAYAMFLYRTFVPTDLAIFYPHPRAYLSLVGWIAALVYLVGVSYWVVRRRTRFPYVFAGWWWFIVALLPVIGIVQVGGQAWADRYAYLPHIGLFVAIVWFLAAGLRRDRLPLMAAAAAVVVAMVLAVVARGQTAHWRDTGTLFSHTIAVTGDNVLARDILGRYYLAENRPEQAAEQFAEAARINPGYAEAWLKLGTAYLQAERLEEAQQAFASGVAANPHHIDLYYQLGRAYTALEDFGKADEAFAAAVAEAEGRNAPPEQMAILLTAQGSALARQERFVEAQRRYREAIAANPRYTLAHYNLAIAYAELGNTSMAEAHARVALDQEPGHAAAQELLNVIEGAKAIEEMAVQRGLTP